MKNHRLVILLVLSCAAAGLHAQSFQREPAGIPVTVESSALEQPWNGGLFDLGMAMTDLDGDGDQDLVFTGRSEGRLYLYRNDGQGGLGNFTFVGSAFTGISLGDESNRLGFTDIDGDRDKDLIVGRVDGQLWVFTNTGDSLTPSFSVTPAWVDSIDAGFQAAPGFGDLSGDGRIDLLLGSYDKGILYFQRTSAGSHTFAFVDTLRDTTGTKIMPGVSAVPGLADIDADGDLDLLVGNSSSRVWYYRNVGNLSNPRFVEDSELDLATPFGVSYLTPVLVDVDGDLDPDLFVATNQGWISFTRNTGTTTVPSFTLVTPHIRSHYLDFGIYASPSFVDIDNDLDLDFFVGKGDSGVAFFRNTGTPANPQFEFVTDRYAGITGGLEGRPSWGDLDNDGDPDLLLGIFPNGIYFCPNSGTPAAPSLALAGLLRDTSNAAVTGRSPVLADLDGDADLDVLSVINTPSGATALLLYRNIGTSNLPRFALQDTLRDAAGSVISAYDLYASCADFDRNGKVDLFIGNSEGAILYYRNTAVGQGYSYVLQTQTFGGVNNGSNYRCLPYLADLDGDNDLDIVVGQMHGGFFLYRNTTPSVGVVEAGDARPGAYGLAQNYPNPFNPNTTITFQLPASSQAILTVYDVLGRQVSRLVDEKREAGIHEVRFDGSNLASGMYVYRLQAEGFTATKRMILMK